ncbi:MAG: hypothetical protein IJB73_04135 [Firmicutes bacterium]|nr:hypothetical protein [Bacillota bacterium]MBQ6900247.1 hypothetical protein [Bacillota bacterium]
MIETTIIVALISGSVTLLVCILNNRSERKKQAADLAQQREEQKQEYELQRQELELQREQMQKQLEYEREKQRKELEAKHDSTIEMISYKLDQLVKKVDLHNNAVERLYLVEKKLEVDEERIKVANRRIGDLEQFHKP